MIKHLNISVFGRVQGVFFRASTQKKAEELNLKGFVQNQEDGSVYIEVEGEEPILDQFVEWCHQGPEAARVDDLKVQEAVVEHFSSFTIT